MSHYGQPCAEPYGVIGSRTDSHKTFSLAHPNSLGRHVRPCSSDIWISNGLHYRFTGDRVIKLLPSLSVILSGSTTPLPSVCLLLRDRCRSNSNFFSSSTVVQASILQFGVCCTLYAQQHDRSAKWMAKQPWRWQNCC